MTTRAARGLPSKTDPSVHPTSLTPNFASWLVQQLLLIRLLSWRKVQNEKGTCQCMCSMAKIKSMPGRDMLSMEGWGNILEGMWMSWGKKRQWHAIGLCPFRNVAFMVTYLNNVYLMPGCFLNISLYLKFGQHAIKILGLSCCSAA